MLTIRTIRSWVQGSLLSHAELFWGRLKNRIYGRLIDSVFLYSLINSYLFSLGWFPSSNLRGGSIDWWLFTETQLGPGESAVSCWTLVEKQEAGFIDVWYMLYFRSIFFKSLPFFNRLISVFKRDRWIHRPVTLHGDTAESRGVCSLLLLVTSTWNTHHFDSVSVMKLMVSK